MKTKKFFIIITILLSILIIQDIAWADVGSFEDYGSGSDSDWDSGSDYDYDYDYGYGTGPVRIYSSFRGGFGAVMTIIMLIVIFVIVNKNLHKRKNTNFNNKTSTTVYQDASIENKIKRIDPEFNAEKFTSFAREVFVKLQNAWTERDWEKIRPFESKELFEQHKMQLEGYIKNNQINVMERICVNWVHLLSFEQYGGNDILKVDLNSRMGDYIIDATTKQVIKGDKTKEYYHTYTLTFIRTTGTLTQKNEEGFNTTNCPNCGAPTVITSSGRCEYCNSVITTDDYGWVLSNLSRTN